MKVGDRVINHANIFHHTQIILLVHEIEDIYLSIQIFKSEGLDNEVNMIIKFRDIDVNILNDIAFVYNMNNQLIEVSD